MPKLTGTGRVVVTTTMNPEAYKAIRQAGLSVGALAEQGFKNIGYMRTNNETIAQLQRMAENLQDTVLAEAERRLELEKRLASYEAKGI